MLIDALQMLKKSYSSHFRILGLEVWFIEVCSMYLL